MSYLADYRRGRGLGFEETFSEAPAGFAVGPFDIGSWDWHEWALAGVGLYVAFQFLAKGVKRAAAPIKKRRRKSQRRTEARRRYESELLSIG